MLRSLVFLNIMTYTSKILVLTLVTGASLVEEYGQESGVSSQLLGNDKNNLILK